MVVEQGKNTAALVHPWSTIVKMALLPWLLGSWVIRSMATTWKGNGVGAAGIWNRGVSLQCMKFLFCWHVAHPFT